ILGASDAATTTVTIRDAAVTIGLVANPSSITYSGSSGMTSLTAVVTNAEGLPVAGATVAFSADKPVAFSNSTGFTDSSGQVTVMMRVQSSQVPAPATIMVTAQTSSGTGQPLKSTIPVGVQ